MVVELDEQVEAQLAREAELLGLQPGKLAARLVESALRPTFEREIPASSSALEQLDVTLSERLKLMDPAVLKKREEAIGIMLTTSKSRFHLPAGVTVKDLIEEGRK